MCGIAGIVAPIEPLHVEALGRMVRALAHRGPDGHGTRVFRHCALGHTRLAIIDVDGGAQPLTSSDERTAITFNGEIYGYRELRSALSDYRYRTQSDTEVILALHARHGVGMVSRLPGMFAFGLWDDERRTLIAARDRFGEKPLYYAVGRGGEFLFASEIKAILASGLIEPELDRRAVARYLRRQCVGPGQSIYANVRALPPAHMLRVGDAGIEVTSYWSPPPLRDDIGIDEAVGQFRTLLGNAVRRQLVADVPVGAFLSGGVDSSTVCAVASDAVDGLRTFSFDFGEEHSEIAYARAVASAYRTRHVELRPNGFELAGSIARVQRICDEPFADTSAVPTYWLAHEARRHVKVALTGDGGDELFGGYAWYRPLFWMVHEARVGMLRWIAARVLNRACRLARLPGAAARELRIMGMGLRRQHASPLSAHHAQMSFFPAEALVRLGLPDDEPDATTARPDAAGTLDDVLRCDVRDYMATDILTKIDRMSMAHGLELRAPFLDVDFASFCLSLPYRMKITADEDKLILRRAYATRWPAVVRSRPKQGFGAPLVRWLADPAVRALERRFVVDPRSPLYDVLSHGGARELLGRATPMQRWTLLVLGVWLEQSAATA